MRTQITRRGDEYVIVIPQSLMAAADLAQDQTLELRSSPGTLTICRTDGEEMAPSLESLIDRITPENTHPETDRGPLQGNERFD